MMIPQPRTILQQLNSSITAPLHPHTITWEHHDDTPATNRYTRTASTSTPNMLQPKQHPPAPQTACPLAPGRQALKAASTSTPNCMPPRTGRQDRKTASTSTPNCMPPGTRPARKTVSTSSPNCMPPSSRPSSSQSSIHQHLKLHAPEHPAVKLANQHPSAPQTACPPAPGGQARKAAPTNTPNRVPPSTRTSQSRTHQHPKIACPLAPGRQARKAASTSTSNCMPPSTRPSSSQSSIHQHLKLHAPHAP